MTKSRKEYLREYQRNRIKQRRLSWIAENGPCVVCGATENLEVDHIDHSTKMYSVNDLWSLSPNNPKRINELKKCQVLCYDCHKEKTKKQLKTAKHGTSTMYNDYSCRCDPCKIAKSIDNLLYRRPNVRK